MKPVNYKQEELNQIELANALLVKKKYIYLISK